MKDKNEIEDVVNPKTEIVEAEVIEEKKLLPAPTSSVSTEVPKEEKKKGKLSVKYRLIAEYTARGYPVEIISKMSGVKPATIYILLEKNELIWEEINRILSSIFSEGDRVLANLYIKSLHKLDEQLSSVDPDTYDKAIDRVIKIAGNRGGGKEKTTILQQFFGQGANQGQGALVEGGIDQLILNKRKERGLDNPKLPVLADDENDDEEGDEE